MRTTLVDWLGEVRDEFRLHGETLFLAAAYLDAYLAAKPVSRDRLQLLGMACLWVAAKFEEVYPPPLAAMLAMAENMYSAADLTAMEKEVLFTLDFGLAVPTPLRFLHYMLQLAALPAHPGEALSCRRLAEALLELSLLDAALLAAPASAVAAAAVYLALGMCRHHAGLQGVVLLSGADPTTLGELVQRLSRNLHEAASCTPQQQTQPQQPLALLSRYRAWEQLYGRTGLAIAAATAAQSAQPAARPAAAGGAAAAQADEDMAAAAAAGMMEHELEFEASAEEEDPHAPSPPPTLRPQHQPQSRPSSSSAAYHHHHLPTQQQPPAASGSTVHPPQPPAAGYAPAAALAAAGSLVAASGGAAAALIHAGTHGPGHPHFTHHHHVMSLAAAAHPHPHHHHHVPVTASSVAATPAGASAAAALGSLRLSSAACY
ncbi:hypothetical protein HYH02_005437 [Chlamydomonas schloesseri]|uniref:Cyclin N-terminal domain-containing protein n=1 Tax=Chlamydomonas schloesseri TaxID=2026947 RepID=A0A835WM65_9CHLO|nr:hypothetical protein HYH02_005437 [Chlamydomonas schloesseri]|eukprot:KAG2449280.1 hypothetical protein HYH02_005437 [Chlamydomonas schloesseri]